MEFQCRLGTEHGQVIEGVYVADDEKRLRRELEEKGLFVLAIKPKGALSLPGLPALSTLGRRRRVSATEFLVFNQELATLLKAGMPLVQSLDILRQKVPNQTFKAVLDDVFEKVRSGTAMSEAFEQHGDLFPPIYTASLLAGEKSGNLDQVLRRFIAYSRVIGKVRRRRRLRPHLSRRPAHALDHRRPHHHREGRAGVHGLLRHLRRGTAAADAHPDGPLERDWLESRLADARARRGRRLAIDLAAIAGEPDPMAPPAAAVAVRRAGGHQVRHVAVRADAGDAARRRHSAGDRARGGGDAPSRNRYIGARNRDDAAAGA